MYPLHLLAQAEYRHALTYADAPRTSRGNNWAWAFYRSQQKTGKPVMSLPV
jgi:hypothetical protein